jgi:hydrogenase nickel incorporation protein HypA/HybF
MHEKALMDDLVRRIESTALAEGGGRVARIRVRLGALSQFSPGHFQEHFELAARGTVAEGAEVEADVRSDPTEPGAHGVVLESLELELEARNKLT